MFVVKYLRRYLDFLEELNWSHKSSISEVSWGNNPIITNPKIRNCYHQQLKILV